MKASRIKRQHECIIKYLSKHGHISRAERVTVQMYFNTVSSYLLKKGDGQIDGKVDFAFSITKFLNILYAL